MAIAGQGGARYHKRDFRADENLKYAEPHFRMRKVAREVRRIARGRECDLLDVGCGPGTLARLMPPGVRYHGVDIAIPAPAPNLIEMDIIEEPVSFRGQTFDVIVAQGLFEYAGEFQANRSQIDNALGRSVSAVVSTRPTDGLGTENTEPARGVMTR